MVKPFRSIRAALAAPEDVRMMILCIPKQRELPDALGDLPALEELVLEVGPSFRFGDALRTLSRVPTLRTLAMRDGEVPALPDEIALMRRLTRFELWSTATQRLSPALFELSQLRELMFHGARWSEFPPGLGRLRALTALAVMNSSLTLLPDEVGELTSLIWCYLQGSSLTSLPESVARLSRLEDLDLTDCPLRALPPMPPTRVLHLRAGQLDEALVASALDPRTRVQWEPPPPG